jgi:hypothetical protein
VEAKPSTENYVALSYVLGQNTSTSTWPKVVLDAIDATRKLGFDYFWIDRHCINHENPAEKHYLISNMKLIYKGTEVTIVAASGTDADSGLPGVGSTSISTQPKVRMSDMTLVSTLCDPRVRIRESV